MARLYWILTSLVLAIAVHAAYVLVAPSYALHKSLDALVADRGVNRFFIVEARDQARLFPAFPPEDVFGACAFDVSAAKIALVANMPEGLWTLTVYSASGDVIYTLNDKQSGTAHFTVTLSLAPSLVEMINQTGNEEPVNTTGWDVQTNEPTGVAVFWIPLSEPAMRAGVVRTLAKTACQVEPPSS